MQALNQLNWQTHHAELESLPKLYDWLSDPGSFMQRLRRYGVDNPRVQVLQQSWQFPAADEKTCLGITARTYALVREVLIVSEGKKWMFARTVFPRDTLTGKQQRLARLKNRALGSVLFKDLSTERHEFEMARVDPGAGCHAFILQHADVADKNIWARRSVFFVQNKPLLLTEFFLPDITSL